MDKKLTESLEKYLLAVYELCQNNDNIKVKDVANYLKIGGPATSDAIKTLSARGFINYVAYGNVSLTPKGNSAVELKLYRHGTIKKFLNKVLEIAPDSAEKNATAIEYSMTEDVLIKFVHFLDFMEQCSCKEPKWVKSCKSTLQNGELSPKCQSCTQGCEKGCNCCANK